MDDLDHSIHISEYDWSSFYDESEECDLLQASLAYSDDFNLSDSEISEKYQQKPKLCPDGETSTAEKISKDTEKTPEQPDQSNIRGPSNNAAISEKEENMCVSHPTTTKKTELAKQSPEISHIASETLQTDILNVQYSGETKDCSLQTERGQQPTKEPDLLSCYKLGLSVDESDIGEKAAGGKKAEKERWFVTVNNNPTRQQRSPAFKKKRKIKNISERGPKTNLGQESSMENRAKMNRKKHKCEGRKLGLSKKIERSGKCLCEPVQEVPIFSKSLITPLFIKENIPKEVIIGSKPNSDGSASASLNTSMSLQVDHVQRDEPERSNPSYDSETHLSATKPAEEPRCPLQTHLIKYPQSSSSPSCDNLAENANQAKNTQMHLKENALCSDLAASNCENDENTSTEFSFTFSSANQRALEPPDDGSTCTHDSPVETSGALTHFGDISDAACSEEDQHALLRVPNLTVSPCTVSDSPETYAKAAGHSKPIYAISAFWDEMEKLTINDILQLRMGNNLSPTQIQKTADTKNLSLKQESRVGTVEYDLADGSQVDSSDTADSDYFTQTDEFKPDRSSHDFSTSDWEEEYSQFLSTNWNPDSDQVGDDQLGSSFYSHVEDSTNSEERETPVPPEDVTAELFNSQEVQMLTSLPRTLKKSTSMYNVQALKTEGFSLLPALSRDHSSLSTSGTQFLEENIDLKEIDDVDTLLPPLLSSYADLLDTDYQMSLPEMFESCLTEDNNSAESQCAIYDPQDISVALVFDHDLCTLMHTSCSSQKFSPENPIPIFSCSHPTVRELTFPKQHFVLSPNSSEMDKISPIRLIYHSFVEKDLFRSSAEEMGCKRFLSFRKISFHDKGSIWCGGSGTWMFPARDQEIPISRENQTVLMLNQRRTCPVSSQEYRELMEEQKILQTVWIKRENLFSSVKQSDMCLVCIAFASWVLRSSDPNAADAWKAALLANVSALSAIQYLRQYVKKRNPPDNL